MASVIGALLVCGACGTSGYDRPSEPVSGDSTPTLLWPAPAPSEAGEIAGGGPVRSDPSIVVANPTAGAPPPGPADVPPLPNPTAATPPPGPEGGPPTGNVAAPPTPELTDYQRNERDLQNLLTSEAEWHAPAFLTEGSTDNIALTIGDVALWRTKIDAEVPTVQPRPRIPITITADVEATLSVIGSDAEVDPVETQNWSVGEDARVYFSWKVKPLVAGELKLSAAIDCMKNGRTVRVESVPLRIPVHVAPAPSPPGLADRVKGIADLVKEYWAQLVAAGAALGATGRAVWTRYRGRGRLAASSRTDETPETPVSVP
ncbi:hypothetical protein A5727_03770 [Mycobacterium sp. ACS4331]|nr:hypothetical protein A5727_03770 [Mycobacterium sp. ACS4331]